MIVLSLFDGMSCGQIALKELGAHVERYYASEVDKFAIAQTQLNFPETEAVDEPQKKCGNCALCIHTHLGGECQLTDNPVEYEQDGCIDHIPED